MHTAILERDAIYFQIFVLTPTVFFPEIIPKLIKHSPDTILLIVSNPGRKQAYNNGLTLKTSILKSLYDGQVVLLIQLILMPN